MQLVAAAPREDEQERVAADVHVRRVRLADRQAERIGRVRARRQHQGESLAQRRRRSRVGDQLGNVAAAQQQARLFDSRPRDVARIRTDHQQQCGAGRRPQGRDQQDALQEAAPARPRALGQGVHRSPTRCVPPPSASYA